MSFYLENNQILNNHAQIEDQPERRDAKRRASGKLRERKVKRLKDDDCCDHKAVFQEVQISAKRKNDGNELPNDNDYSIEVDAKKLKHKENRQSHNDGGDLQVVNQPVSVSAKRRSETIELQYTDNFKASVNKEMSHEKNFKKFKHKEHVEPIDDGQPVDQLDGVKAEILQKFSECSENEAIVGLILMFKILKVAKQSGF